jgi:hypothetical protein
MLAAFPATAREQEAAPPVAAGVRQPGYRLAFTGGISLGTTDWGTEISGATELSGRVLVLPWLTAGISYLRVSSSNNEGFDPFRFQALALHAGWRPIVGRWFDPFVQLGALAVVSSGGGYMNRQTTARWGLESTAGIDFVLLPFAAGFHAQYGFTDQSWRFVGLHLEVRI